DGQPERLALADFQKQTWATRQNLWVDRLASAWLIRRFIDRKARFIWLQHVKDCPASALGFDFDGARFTHIGHRVTFETLLASFDLEGDVALMRIGAIVHALDVGGEAPEAAGFETLLKGLKARIQDDDALLKQGGQMLDDLYAVFSSP
ncbi:MAG: chromate resistance protein ChrB domain-containing protein, partial [Thiobacillus sp.]